MDIVGIENISLADLEDRYRQHLKQYKYWKNREFKPWGIITEEKELVRVYNMLATHGFMICSLKGLLVLQKCLLEDYYRNRGYDMTLAQLHPHINAYAFKKPLVYQFGAVGGCEKWTKFEIVENIEKKIPTEWINYKSLAYLTSII